MAAVTLQGPERATPHARPHRAPPPRLLLVGGVPGAGKTTVLESLAGSRPGSTTVDPDRFRRRLAAVLPGALPYRCYRLVVHVWSTAVLLALVLRGPTPSRRALLVHDPATRRRRRSWTAGLARARGWDPVLVVLDVSRGAALEGQHARRRVLGQRSFDAHWQRWQEDRPGLVTASERRQGHGPWSAVHVVDRTTAVPVVTRLLS